MEDKIILIRFHAHSQTDRHKIAIVMAKEEIKQRKQKKKKRIKSCQEDDDEDKEKGEDKEEEKEKGEDEQQQEQKGLLTSSNLSECSARDAAVALARLWCSE